MILDNNPRIDVAVVRDRVRSTLASRRRETLAPVPEIPRLLSGSDASGADAPNGGTPSLPRQLLESVPIVGPRLVAVARLLAIPVIGPRLVSAVRAFRRMVAPHSPLRRGLKTVPLVGSLTGFLWALVQLPKFRNRASLSIDLMREQVAALEAWQQEWMLPLRDLPRLQARVRRLEQLAASQARALRAYERALRPDGGPPGSPAIPPVGSAVSGPAVSGPAVSGPAAPAMLGPSAEGSATSALSTTAMAAPSPVGLGSFYVDFEDRFRGSTASIAERLSLYLPLVDAAVAGRGLGACVDIGCGRGEWLGLLRARGLEAVGIDLDAGMVESCRSFGLDARQGDGIAWLESRPADSVDVVTAFQVIEHLDLPNLLRLLDATIRALAPRGVAIFETPNPENLLVGAHTFHIDPSHVRPVPPQTAEFLALHRGFARVEIRRANPYPDSARIEQSGEIAERLNALLYGPQDYALIAWKSA